MTTGDLNPLHVNDTNWRKAQIFAAILKVYTDPLMYATRDISDFVYDIRNVHYIVLTDCGHKASSIGFGWL